MGKKFDVRMDPDAAKEYQKLDAAYKRLVNKSIDELEFRADEVGKPLGNQSSSKLAGCKEIKLRDIGIRIIFRVTNETVDVLRIVYIVSIEQRSKDFVFRISNKRYGKFKNIPKAGLKEYLARQKKWKDERKEK